MSSSPKMAVSAVRAEDAGKGSILLDSRDDGVTVAVVNGSFVSLVDTETGGVVDCAGGHDGPVRATSLLRGAPRVAADATDAESCVVASTVGDDKRVRLWNARGAHVATYDMSKKPCSAAFVDLPEPVSQRAILVGDRFGDVYAFPADDAGATASEKKARLLLGHTASVITDLAVSSDNAYVMSADRDEKVRISPLPFTHRPAGFCLGHYRHISRVLVPRSSHGSLLLTGAGDGRVMLWEVPSAKRLCSVEVGVVPVRATPTATPEEAAAALAARDGGSPSAGGAGGSATPAVDAVEEGDTVSVLTQCPVRGTVAVAVSLRPEIHLLNIVRSPDGDPTLEKVGTINAGGEPIDGVFDAQGRLTVALAWAETAAPTLVTFELEADGGRYRRLARAPEWVRSATAKLAGASASSQRLGVSDTLMQRDKVKDLRVAREVEASTAKR